MLIKCKIICFAHFIMEGLIRMRWKMIENEVECLSKNMLWG